VSSIAEKITSSRLLIHNISLNFVIQGITFLIGIVTVPAIIHGIGVFRFGLLTIIWALIGYASLFDLGLGRALTQVVSRKLGEGNAHEIPSIIWTSLVIIAGLGISGAFILSNCAGQLAVFLKVPPEFYTETMTSIQYLALSIPFLIIIFALKGVLEAYQRFDYANWLRVPIIISNYVLPLLLLNYYKSLSALVLMLVIGRIFVCFGYFWAVMKVVDGFPGKIKVEKRHFQELFRFGGWLTVSSVINPFMTYLDRFVVAGILSAQVVAYYATPYDVISKLSIVSAAVMSVIFPALATEFAKGSQRARVLYEKSLLSLSLILFVPVIILICFAKPLIGLWINPDFSQKSFVLAQILAISFFVNCLNTVPYSVIQATGRADITAKIYLLELPIYIASLYFFIKTFGIVGAPLACLLRIIIDSFLMHNFALSFLNQKQEAVANSGLVEAGTV
jgi:O-antigen/teichoic acid export membrane protein